MPKKISQISSIGSLFQTAKVLITQVKNGTNETGLATLTQLADAIRTMLSFDSTYALSSDLVYESNNRITTDDELRGMISEESTSRTQANEDLQNAISSEAAIRSTTDDELRGMISEESTSRTQANEDLQNAIDKIAFPVTSRLLKPSRFISENDTPNAGIMLNIISYDVDGYGGRGSRSFENIEDFHSTKIMLSKFKPEIMGVQRDNRLYADLHQSINIWNELYSPVFPFQYGDYSNSNTIKSRYRAELIQKLYFPDSKINAGIIAAYIQIGSNPEDILLFISTYLDNSTAYQDYRHAQYDAIINWVNGDAQLYNKSKSIAYNVNPWKWCIICGGFSCNYIEDDNDEYPLFYNDIMPLKTACENGGFVPANGGWLGWFNTLSGKRPIVSNPEIYNAPVDNILVSSNITINSIEVPEWMEPQLLSSHLPIFANVTLRDEQHIKPNTAD